MIIGKLKYNQHLVPDPEPEPSVTYPLPFRGNPAGGPTDAALVRYGVYRKSIHSYQTIAEFREEYARRWHLTPDAVAYRGTRMLGEDSLICPGDTIEFHRRVGR